MKIIILGIVILVIFFTRKIWAKYLVVLFAKFKNQDGKKITVKNLDNGSVFSPKGTVRTFILSIDIEEMGDGTVKITLAKDEKK